jgi:hypothetical protein
MLQDTTTRPMQAESPSYRGIWRSARLRYGCSWRSLQPKAAFWRFPPVHRVDLKRQQRVDLARSTSRRCMTAICAFETFERLSRIDVNLPFQIAALNASIGRKARLRGSP